MDGEFLPGDLRDRIQDLLKHNNVTQADLAAKIGCNESLISRFLSGKTNRLGDKYIIRIARTFHVSTDFLLGESNIPDRKNYEIEELGLSVQAAKNLYTGKASADVVGRLLESPRFCELTYMIEQYFDNSLSAGYAAQNQMYSTLSAMLRKTTKADAAVESARAMNRMKVPVYQADLNAIQTQFMSAVKEVKQEIGNDLSAAQKMTSQIAQKMFSELTKGQDVEQAQITPEGIADAVLGMAGIMDGTTPESLDKFGQSLTEFIRETMENAKAQQEKDHAEHEQ
ncbi:Predicted transcriptional regulators [[Clostridium] symbiosum]|uniref:DNA-binding helix-turn-helix protein n=1 Tax=[Clostridium] symbiosum ATCC 14940 TaxID=411472 RepID=A0ABC9TUI8_CLOSY|nr:helix-turn-helix transcriptional regulator [[Clostridium] symbiosum]ERI74917.1 DNA-binding helix-turn-helix protein [[Clostridium] symbiosum ATCC 14940]SUY55985.1 Predicted transcriptional regulators [[Clostridium] symbiosum]